MRSSKGRWPAPSLNASLLSKRTFKRSRSYEKGCVSVANGTRMPKNTGRQTLLRMCKGSKKKAGAYGKRSNGSGVTGDAGCINLRLHYGPPLREQAQKSRKTSLSGVRRKNWIILQERGNVPDADKLTFPKRPIVLATPRALSAQEQRRRTSADT